MVELPKGVTRIRWTLHEDNGGTVQVWRTQEDADADTKIVFESLDELPPEIAAVILADGRDDGELTRR